ncbi:MAG TPA: GGDEF domain-containing protein [Polyangiaceae bacterium]|jgi:diguanylate cyclase (GGDEF)-like protein|nr:GGDEF domain-containing protein [Polyangiaceae bacterium]
MPIEHNANRDPRVETPSSVPDDYDERPTRPGDLLIAPAAVREVAEGHALLTVLTGANAGEVFTLTGDQVHLGRGKDAEARIDGVGISRRHARILRTADGRRILEDLGASNGVLVNGRRIERIELVSGDRVQLGPVVVLRFAVVDGHERALAYQLYEGSTRDALTRTYNRRYMNERLAEEIAYARRHSTRLSLMMLDLDHFKRVNDQHGHGVGDMVLRIAAAQLQRIIRKEDVLARYGGEEFLVLLRGIEHANAGILAERLRRSVESLSIPCESGPLRVTVSVGVASLHECDGNAPLEAVVQLADERLYRAKSEGRNRVCL